MSPGSRVRSVIVGTRGSALARAQTNIVVRWLAERYPDLRVTVRPIRTTGDVQTDVPLSVLGGRGVFVDAIEDALRRSEVDVAVHSAKDLPALDPEDLFIAAYPSRGDARDVLVSRHGEGHLSDLPIGAVVGTSSQRRGCQLLALRLDLSIRDLRGNVDTRLRKLDAGDYDAIVLAGAGLARLGMEKRATEWLPLRVMLPAPAQGALAVQIRAGDTALRDIFAPLNDRETAIAVRAERAFLARLGSGCAAAVSAYARMETRDTIRMDALIGTDDGQYARAASTGKASEPETMAAALADRMSAGIAGTYLRAARPAI